MSFDTIAPPLAASAPEVAEDRNAAVIEAIVGHHAALSDQLRQLTGALLAGVRAGTYAAERSRLLDWFTGELMPHAEAEEMALYGVGADLEPTRLLVRGMVTEHRLLAQLIYELEHAGGAIEVVAAASAAHALFVAHLGKENDLLLPALAAAGMDLGAALDGMHEILGDPTALGQAQHGCGCGGCGCSDAAAAADTPASASVESIEISPSVRPGELDVRALPHGGRHEIIFDNLNVLGAGESLVIVNDHDPKPLRYQTEAMWPDQFTWTYLESGPVLWRVAISRVG